ncbi:hypothetical protein VIN01S_34770 [Vibrio inusitatus NBRC 102082]|uniref:DUF4381 domain-containing protein n=1 Tax=Vibrio inusitatus NBRC 102082 TaxID=1219070 RepID=A0A4Y3HZQ5_9VIBR|nr:DUF4381 domain-containing protein [Vibrio inusitatus]GEA52673.1 hypothetical protein VIN01S_34770 [Vibrio inusitatus NBRC 102082]
MTVHTPPQSYMLRDIVEVAVAPSVSWMPETIGWKVVGVTVMLCVSVWAYKSLYLWWSNRYRREALQSFDLLLKACESTDNKQVSSRQTISQDVHHVLKTVLSTVNPATRPYYGLPFLQSLDAQNESTRTVFADKWSHWPESMLVQQNALSKVELIALIADCKVWVKQHVVQASGAEREMSDA